MQIKIAAVIALALLANAAPQQAGQGKGTGFPITKHATRSWLKADGSVNLDVVDSHVEFIAGKIQNRFENFERNTGRPHPSAVKGFEKRDKRGVGFTLGDAAEGWYGVIMIGKTPYYAFYVELDTASADLLVPSVNCDSSCDGHYRWDPSTTPSAFNLNLAFTERYGKYLIASGDVYTAAVTMGPYSGYHQVLGAVSHYSPGFQVDVFQADGRMGLGFYQISILNASSFYEYLVENEILSDSAHAFSFKFEPTKGDFYLGGADPVLYTGDFSYAPTDVHTSGFWEVTMDNIQSNGQIILQNIKCIIDTTSTIVIGSPSDVATLSAAVNGSTVTTGSGANYITFPCNAFPNIAFTFGGTPFTMSASTLNLGPIPSNTSECLASIMGQDTSATSWIIGVAFLQNVYTTFDSANSQVGFAQLA